MKRAPKILGQIVCGLLATFLLASCATSDEVKTEKVVFNPDWSFKAELNYETGEIVLPVEKYSLSRDEENLVFATRVHFMTHCIQSKGVDSDAIFPVSRSDKEDRRFGYWLMANAEKFGFTIPVDEKFQAQIVAEEAEAEKHADDQAWQEAYQNAQESCAKEDVAEELALSNIPEPPRFDLSVLDLALESAEAKVVFADWEKCINDNGLERDLDMSLFAVKGVSYEVADEQSIKAAVINAQCKADTDYTQRMADIMAAAQGPFVKKHEAELQEYYDAQLVVFGKAQDYLAKNVPEWNE